MKASTVTAVLAPSVTSAQWWGGAPGCAHSCLSSAYATGTTTGVYWPAQSDYCAVDKVSQISSCMTASCSATPTAISSYSSMSSSLCSQWSSCEAAGSTGVHTITYSGGPVGWGVPGGWGGRGGKGFGGPGLGQGGWSGVSDQSSLWSEWASVYSGSKTWTGGVVTVTGCVGNGSPWFAGPGCGWNDKGGFNGWIGWGDGWSMGSTSTGSVSYTTTNAQGSVSTFTGVATVVAAVSGDFTTSTVLAAQTSEPTGNAAARVGSGPGAGSEGNMVTGMMGIALGAVVAVAGLL